MGSSIGRKNGEALAPDKTLEMFAYYVRIHFIDGEFLSVPVTCSAHEPPKLSEVLESNWEKFAELHPTSTGDIYGYVKRYDQEWDEYVDLEPEFCSRTPVRPKDKLQLWYNHEKKHPNAVLLSEREEQDPVYVKPRIHLQIFKNNNVMVERDLELVSGVQHPITALIKHISAEFIVLAGPNQHPHKIFGWVTKNLGQNKYIEAHLDDDLEGGAVYQLHFVEFKHLIQDDLTAYFVLSNSDKGELQLVRVERQNREENRQNQDAFCHKREEDPFKCKHEEITAEVSLVKSCVFPRVFKDNKFVVDDIFSFEPSTPHTFRDLISYLDEKHNLVKKYGMSRDNHSYAWILKVVDENKYTEVDLKGVLEDGMYYHVCCVPNRQLIEGVSAFLKLHCRPGSKKLRFQFFKRKSVRKTTANTSSDGCVDEDPAMSKHEEISKVAPVESCIFLRVYRDQRVVAERCLSFNPSTPYTFRRLIDRIDADHNVFAKSVSHRRSIYACLFKVVNDQKLIEVDLKGVVDNGMSYHVHLAASKYAIEGGASAIFKISYGGRENKKLDFELIKTGSACDKKVIYDRIKESSKQEDQAALSAKPEFSVHVFKNEKYLRGASVLITRNCLTFKSLIRILNRNLKICDKHAYAWILKNVGDDRYDEVDLEGVVEEGATYRVHISTSFVRLSLSLEKDVNVTAYFKVSCDVKEKLEFEYVVCRQKNKENSAGKLKTPEENVPSNNYEEISSNKVPQSSYSQPREDLNRFESGELEKVLEQVAELQQSLRTFEQAVRSLVKAEKAPEKPEPTPREVKKSEES